MVFGDIASKQMFKNHFSLYVFSKAAEVGGVVFGKGAMS